MKLRGKKVGDAFKWEAKWALLGGIIAEGRIDGTKDGGTALVLVTPEGSTTPVSVSAYYTLGEDNIFGFSVKKGDEKLVSYDGKLKR